MMTSFYFFLTLSTIFQTSLIYSNVSSYTINWSKSSLLPLNSASKEDCTDYNIPVVSHFKYLGVNVFTSLQKTITKNYNNTLSMLKQDLERWQKLPIFLSGRISIIKMNVLPRVKINHCDGQHSVPRLQWTLPRKTASILRVRQSD